MLEVLRKLQYLPLLNMSNNWKKHARGIHETTGSPTVNILNYWKKHARSIQKTTVSPTVKYVKLLEKAC